MERAESQKIEIPKVIVTFLKKKSILCQRFVYRCRIETRCRGSTRGWKNLYTGKRVNLFELEAVIRECRIVKFISLQQRGPYALPGINTMFSPPGLAINIVSFNNGT